MFSTLTRQPFCQPIYLFINLSFSHFESGHPSCMLAAQASVTACHSEFQMAPIFPLMARRSGRQHIGEGGPRHGACSRGSIREKRGSRGEVWSITPPVMYSFFFYDYFGDCFLIQGCVARLIVPSLLLAGLLMVALPCSMELSQLAPTLHIHAVQQ